MGEQSTKDQSQQKRPEWLDREFRNSQGSSLAKYFAIGLAVFAMLGLAAVICIRAGIFSQVGEETKTRKKVATNGKKLKSDSPPQETPKIDFEQLRCSVQEDIVVRPWMITDEARALDGSRVRIRGYMHGGVTNHADVKEFILLKNTKCKFGPGGRPDCVIMVTMKNGENTTYPGERVIEVVGQLHLDFYTGADGNTWSLYRMNGESVRKQ